MKHKGFTIIELLLYMGLFSIFLVVLTDIFTSILSVQSESEATSAVEIDSRYILSRLGYDIRRADAIVTPGALGATSTTLAMTIGGASYAYALNGTSFQLTSPLGTLAVNSSESEISGLTFQKIGNSGGKETIRIAVTVSSAMTRAGGKEVRNFQTTIGRR